MSDELTPLQKEAVKAKEGLCRSIGDHGCGGCPLDELRREKNVDCDKACLYYPMLVVEAAAKDKNGTEQPKATSQEANTDWEKVAKWFQNENAKWLRNENKRLKAELDAERQRNAQLEKDIAQKDKLKERVVGQRDAYLNVLSMMLDGEE